MCRNRHRNILHRHALTGIGHIGFFGAFFRERKGVDEAVMDHDPLGTVFADAFGFLNVDAVDQFPKQDRRQRLHFHEFADRADEIIPADLHGFLLLHFLLCGGDLCF